MVPETSQFVVAPPEGTSFVIGVRLAAKAAISPDGRTLAFTARNKEGTPLLWLRPIRSLTAQPVPGTEGASSPFWSPDSTFIGYSIREKLRKVAASGGQSPQTVCALLPGMTGRGGAWSRGGVIIFNNGPRSLYRAPAAGGEASRGPARRDSRARSARLPARSPDHFRY